MESEYPPPSGKPDEEEILDSYDPLLDPSYRLVVNWAQQYEDSPSWTSLVPVAHDVWMVFNSVNSMPASMSYWSLKPHRDPSLQLWLARNCQLIALKLIPAVNPEKKLGFPLKEETTLYLFVNRQMAVSNLARGAKNVVRMMTGTALKLCAYSPVDTEGNVIMDGTLMHAIPLRDVKMRSYTMEIGTLGGKRPAYKLQLPRIRDLNPDLGKKAEGFARAWGKLSIAVRENPSRCWHKGRLTTMLSDDYWDYAVAKVASELSPQRLTTMLVPAPVTQWWFEKLTAWALMDVLAVENLPEEDHHGTFMDLVYEAWSKSPKRLTRTDRRRAVEIRTRLGIPPFSANQSEEAAQMIAKLNLCVCRYMPRMMLILQGRQNLGLNAAQHPFWAKKLEQDLRELWPQAPAVPTSGKEGRVRIYANFPGFARENPAFNYVRKYEFEEGTERAGLNRILKSILDEKAALATTSVDTILCWLQRISSRREEFCVPQLLSLQFGLIATNLRVKPVTSEDRWLLKMTYANASANATLDQHPWFSLIEHVALPREMSDLAWRIPDKYWTSQHDGIERNRAKKFKYMSNKVAKCVTLALYFAQHVKEKLSDPSVLEIVEFAALLSSERPFQQLKVMAYTEAGNLSLTTAEYFLNPTRRWSHLSKMMVEHKVMASNSLPYVKDGKNKVEALTVWAHVTPRNGKLAVIFQIAETDRIRIQPSPDLDDEENKLRSTLGRKLAEINSHKGATWQMAMRKLKWTAMKLGLHSVILATSVQAETEVIALATAPNNPELKEHMEMCATLRQTFIEALAENTFPPSEEDLAGVLMPVVLTLVEENTQLGTFFWRRTVLKDRQGWKSNSIIYGQMTIVAPGQIPHLRNLRDWGLAHVGGRTESRSEQIRARNILDLFEKELLTGGVTRAVVAILATFTAQPEDLVKPTWIESLSALGLGARPIMGAFNAGPIWKLED